MIVHKFGVVIDTENMDNNHLYTYCISGDMIHKVEVNFTLEEINEFLEIVKNSGTTKEELVENIEYELLTKRPIEKRPYDEILEFLCDPKDFLQSPTLLGPNTIKKAYLKWLEYPSIYHEIKSLVDFKTQSNIDKTKDIDLNHYLEELEKINLSKEFMDILNLKIINTMEKCNLENLNKYVGNGFINIDKQVEIANRCLEYGIKNKDLVKRFK
ncbi:MAG: hypothetical protein E7157_05900 [Lactobacillales bacterium]|nr:hypothetical protein [Lactobacillales bacterium]